MCGIAGWFRRSNQPVSKTVVEQMCDTIVSRGPDDSGYFVDGDFGFGMRRLSIIDIEGGHQPMFTPDGRYAIVFNGELYNHLDVRLELERAGVTFRTHSDTETLLLGFAQWGDGAWIKFEGMFAAAVWDRQARRLTLARDPLGIKPLYMTQQHGGIAFASEIRALRALPITIGISTIGQCTTSSASVTSSPPDRSSSRLIAWRQVISFGSTPAAWS